VVATPSHSSRRDKELTDTTAYASGGSSLIDHVAIS